MSRRKRRKGKAEPRSDGLGRRLATVRTAKGLTQTGLANLAGLRRASLSSYEADLSVPDAAILGQILEAMELRWSALDLTEEYLTRLAAECSLSGSSRVLGQGEFSAILHPEEDREKARAAWRELKALSQERQEERLQEIPAEISWALAELLCLESQEACREDLVEAQRQLDLALNVAERVTGTDAWRAKVRGFVWLHIGTLLRVRGKLDEAERAFISADHLWEAGRGARPDLLEEGLIFASRASLRRAERRFEEARELIEKAEAAAIGDEFRVQVLVFKAKLFEEMGDLEGAVATLQEAREKPPALRDRAKFFYIDHNLADALSKLGRFEKARTLLCEVKRLSRTAGALDRVRISWTEGRVAVGLERVEEGIGLLTKVRGEFASRGMWYDTALLTLELATVYAELGRTGDVKTLARHLVPIFQGKGVHREALTALTLFRQAAEKESATVELARRILHFLRQARHDPGLRFEAF